MVQKTSGSKIFLVKFQHIPRHPLYPSTTAATQEDTLLILLFHANENIETKARVKPNSSNHLPPNAIPGREIHQLPASPFYSTRTCRASQNKPQATHITCTKDADSQPSLRPDSRWELEQVAFLDLRERVLDDLVRCCSRDSRDSSGGGIRAGKRAKAGPTIRHALGAGALDEMVSVLDYSTTPYIF